MTATVAPPAMLARSSKIFSRKAANKSIKIIKWILKIINSAKLTEIGTFQILVLAALSHVTFGTPAQKKKFEKKKN